METVKKDAPRNNTSQKQYKWDIVWFNVIGFAILHLATVYGWYMVLTNELKLATLLWTSFVAYISVLGTTVGAHRLFTHKCFKANSVVRAILLVCFTIAGQNCLWVWVRDHRQHHKYSDTDADPHNASRGFFFSHIGWLMVRKQPEVISKGKVIDMSDLDADSLIMFQKRYYKTWFTIFSILIPSLVPYYFWNEDLWKSFIFCFVTRIMSTLNGTWLVNSAAHIYGNRPFSQNILPTENEFVSFIGAGEGWHNYHHSFPWDYKAAELGQHYNLSKTVIEYFEKKGWAWGLKYATPEMVRYRVLKRGDGTHPKYGKLKCEDNDYKTEEDDYDKLKRDAETVFNDENNNEIIDKKNDLGRESKIKIIEGIYKLVE